MRSGASNLLATVRADWNFCHPRQSAVRGIGLKISISLSVVTALLMNYSPAEAFSPRAMARITGVVRIMMECNARQYTPTTRRGMPGFSVHMFRQRLKLRFRHESFCTTTPVMSILVVRPTPAIDFWAMLGAELNRPLIRKQVAVIAVALAGAAQKGLSILPKQNGLQSRCSRR